MRDISSNWKVRTSTIDDIHISIQAAIDTDPELILSQAETLLDFFVSLLSDQNFKIVLMTLSIINLVISMPQHLQSDDDRSDTKSDKAEPHGLSTSFLSRCVPRLVSKLSDSKNIIRQQAIRALMGIFLIMRSKAKPRQDLKGST
jgi:phosphatidate phosphatase PAH1